MVRIEARFPICRESARGSTPRETVRGVASIFPGVVDECSISPRAFSSSARLAPLEIGRCASFLMGVIEKIVPFLTRGPRLLDDSRGSRRALPSRGALRAYRLQ